MNKTQRTYISTVNIHLIMKQVTLFGKLVPSQKQPWFKSVILWEESLHNPSHDLFLVMRSF